MKKLLAVLCIILTVALIACQPAAQTPQPSPSPSQALPSQPAPAEQPTPQQETRAAVVAKPDVNTQDPDVVKLFAKNNQVKSYSFSVAELPDKRGSHQYYVRGNKIKVVPTRALVREGDIDVVFLDSATKTAAAYCINSNGCDTPNDPMAQSYDDWAVVLPTQWIEQAKYGRKVGSLTFYDKPVTVIRYEADGKYYEVYLDNFFGYPQRVAIATDAEMTNIIGGYEYRQMAFNSIKDIDVIHVDE